MTKIRSTACTTTTKKNFASFITSMVMITMRSISAFSCPLRCRRIMKRTPHCSMPMYLSPTFISRQTTTTTSGLFVTLATTALRSTSLSSHNDDLGGREGTTKKTNITERNHIDTAGWTLELRPATIDDLDLLLSWEEQDYMQNELYMGDAEYNDWDWENELSKTSSADSSSWRHHLIAQLVRNREEEREKYTDKQMDQRSEKGNSTVAIIPIGMVQVMDPSKDPTQYWGDDGSNEEYIEKFCRSEFRAIDIWIGNEKFLGQGWGTQMMNIALQEYCFSPEKDDDNDDGGSDDDDDDDVKETAVVEAVLVDPMIHNKRAHHFYQEKCGFEPIGTYQFGPDKCLVHKLTRTKWLSLLKRQ